MSASSEAITLARRPLGGTLGLKRGVWANHFLVEVMNTDLCHYDVTITPEITSKVNRDVIATLKESLSYLGDQIVAYDGRKGLYTAVPLPFEYERNEFKVNWEYDTQADESSSTISVVQVFRVTMKFVSRLDIHHLQQFLAGKPLDASQDTIKALNVLLRHNPSTKSFCSSLLMQRGMLGDGVTYRRGYYQRLRPTQMGLSLNIDVSARSSHQSIMVLDFITKYFQIQDMSKPLSNRKHSELKEALRNVTVVMNNGLFNKSYKITGISSNPASDTKFVIDEETMFNLREMDPKISVPQYFHRRYNICLRYPSLPALEARDASKLFYLPMERCKIVMGQRYIEKLNDPQVTGLSKKATCPDQQHKARMIENVVGEKSLHGSGLVTQFGIKVDTKPVLIDARVLEPPVLGYGQGAVVSPAMGKWDMSGKKWSKGGEIASWTCLNFSPLDYKFSVCICARLIKTCNSNGMAFCLHPLLRVRSARPEDMEKALNEVHEKASKLNEKLQLLIIILPDSSPEFYGKIKRLCDTKLGIVTQCCLANRVSTFSKQYLEHVSLKINVKVGGRNAVLSERRIPFLTERPTIVFGATVTPARPGKDSTSSVAAVVASMDWPEVAMYRGLLSLQTRQGEIILDLCGMIRELLLAFETSIGQKPERILFYRAGVSEGQFSQVLLHELDGIRKACLSFDKDYLPPITFFVVQKTHHTRLCGSVLPGTVVDTKICHPTEFDFYLNSHSGIQGISKPSHYRVLIDENGFSSDGLQVLTNNLCYTYARCTRSISVVPPVRYARLLASRARCYMEGCSSGEWSVEGDVQPLPEIMDDVKNVMFYC